jgi:uncharacterized protein (UPF0297 family)
MANIFQVLEQKLAEEASAAHDFLISGGPKDFTEYKEATGLIRGLNVCQRIIQELQRKYDGDDDDE